MALSSREPVSQELEKRINELVDVLVKEDKKSDIPAVFYAELGLFAISEILNALSIPRSGISMTNILARFSAYLSMANIGGDLGALHTGQPMLTPRAIAKETLIACSLMTLTSYLEGNSLSFGVSAWGVLMSGIGLYTNAFNFFSRSNSAPTTPQDEQSLQMKKTQ